MPGVMHGVMGRTAWRSLPEKDKLAWGLRPEIPPWAPEFLRRLPQPASVEDKIATYSELLDLMGWQTKELRKTPEFLVRGRMPVPHGGAARDMGPVWCGESLWDPWACREILRWFVRRLVEEIGREEMERAAMTAAALAHYIEDAAAVCHVVPNSLFYDIMPEETENHHTYHAALDSVQVGLEERRPALLGTTVEELVFRLGVLLDRNYKLALRGMIAQLESARRNDLAHLQELIRPLYQNAADALGGLLHTAIALGKGMQDADEMARLGRFDLTSAAPWYIHPGGAGYGPVVPVGNSIVDGKLAPLAATIDGVPRRIRQGLGMSSFSSVRYILEPKAFDRFEGKVALSSEQLKDQEEGMDVEFLVSLSPEWETAVLGDFDFEPPLRKIFSAKLAPNMPNISFSVELGDARTLLFAILPHPRMVDGHERCWFPHVAVVEPELVKTSDDRRA